MIWRRVCGVELVSCPRYLPPVAGSRGVTAVGCCGDPAFACTHREARDLPLLGVVAARPMVAGYLVHILGATPTKYLYDVLPCIGVGEWPILLSFACDYTKRGIPWCVCPNGQCWTMLKRMG